MKSRSLQFLPRTLVVCFAPLLVCGSASADVMVYNEANDNGVWNIPAGTNLLNMPGNVVTSTSTSNTPPPANTPPGKEGPPSTSTSWATLSDGILGNPLTSGATYRPLTVTPDNGDTVTYALDLTGHPDGYEITAFDSYSMWGDSARNDQRYTLQYSTDGIIFSNIGEVINNDGGGNAGPKKGIHSSLTDTSGVLAYGVKYVKVIFSNPQENNYAGYTEFLLRANPTNVVTTRESSTSTGSFTLPAGTNLLNGSTATATPGITVKEAVTQTSLTYLTNGLLGPSTDHAASVAPNNNTSMVFPLNTAVNFNGYNISSIDAYAAWTNSGRDNQMLDISYSTVDAPATYIPLGTAVLNTGDPFNSTHVQLTPASGFLATRVANIKFNTGHQENGYVGLREFIALGSAVSISDPLTWTGASGAGGNATWTAAADNNWKKTIGGSPGTFSSLAALTFDNTGTNPNISVSAPLTASSMAISSGAYTFGGSLVTVSNDIVSSGSGSATFNNAMKATTGVSVSGSSNLVFNGALESTGIVLAGGAVTVNAANPALTGSVAVSDGVLTVSHDNGLQNAGLAMTGGTALFTSAAPHVGSITSSLASPGSIILGLASPAVNTTLAVGDAASASTFGGTIGQASGTVGGLTKTGASTLTLAGENTYTGVTTVTGGILEFEQPLSLYGGNTAAWTASNLVVGAGGTLAFTVGGPVGFTEANVDSDLSLGGFAAGSFIGLNTASDTTLARSLTQPGLGLVKSGTATLNLTGTNTSNGLVKVLSGALNAAGTGGPAINGNVVMGSGAATITLNMGGNNQIAPTSLITFTNGNFYDSKINLRGTSQTVAGLDSAPFPANKVALIQNDEIGQAGYVSPPGDASLTINATTNHSFYGLIRNQEGGPVSVIKNGLGTQEFQNSYVAGYSYTGPTTINEGTLRINFAGGTTGFGSNITVGSGARLEFNAVGGDYNFDRELHGPGQIAATGTNAIRFRASGNSFTGGLTVGSPGINTYNGFLALVSTGPQGAGNGPDQTCVGGKMIPSNVLTVQGGATLALDGIAPLGESTVLPQYAPSVVINNSGLRGSGLAFVANLTLNHAEVTVGNGIVIAGFDTALCFVGTVTVGGDSSLPSTIITPTPGPSANVSLGSAALPGTVFDVADVTASTGSDLLVGASLRNVNNLISSLTKRGAGTMELQANNTYTGTTHVEAGELRVNQATLADSADVSVDAAGTLNLQFASVDNVSRLTLAGVGMTGGLIYGSTTNLTPGIVQTPRITGPGMLYVANSPITDPYIIWSSQISNVNDRDRSDDPDKDGFTNGQEFLFGTSPIASTGSLSTIEDTGSGLIVRWNQRAAGTSVYVLQESTTLINPWGVSGATIINNPIQDVPDYVRKQATIPVDNAKKFVRVFGTE